MPLKDQAKSALESEKGKGTTVKATFGLSHVDRQPMGILSAH